MADAPTVKLRITADDGNATEAVRALAAEIVHLGRATASTGGNLERARVAARGAGESFSLLRTTVSVLRPLLAGLTVAELAITLKDAVSHALELGETIHKMQAETGASAESLSVLNVAAQSVNLSQEDLSGGLGRLSKSLGGLQAGSRQAVTAFGQIGLAAKDFQGLSLDQSLVVLANRLNEYEDGAAKATVAQQIFGKSGAALLPLLKDLADGGFDATRKKAEALGLVMSQDAVDAAHRYDQAITDLKLAGQGAALQFAEGLTPTITKLAEKFREMSTAADQGGAAIDGAGADAAKSESEFKKAGAAMGGLVDWFGKLGRLLLAGTAGIASWVTVLILDIGTVVSGLGAIASALAQLSEVGIPGVTSAFRGMTEAFQRNHATVQKGLTKDLQAIGFVPGTETGTTAPGITPAGQNAAPGVPAILQGAGSLAPTPTQGKKQIPLQGTGDAEALTKARLQLAKAEADAEVNLAKARDAQLEAEAQIAYQQGLDSLTEYFAARRKTVQDSIQQEIDALLKARQVAAAAPTKTEADRVKQQATLATIDGQIAVARVNAETKIAQLTAEEETQRLQLAQAVLAVENKIRAARGDTLAAAFAEIAQEREQMARTLAQENPHVDHTAELDAFTGAATAEAEFHKLQGDAELVTSAIQLNQDALDHLVETGAITQTEATQRALAFQQAQLGTVQQLIAALTSVRDQIIDPAIRAALDQELQRLQAIGASVDHAKTEWSALKDALPGAAEGTVSEFLGQTIDQVHSVGEAFQDLVLTVARSVQQLVANLVGARVGDAIRKLIAGPVTGAAASPSAATTAASAASTVASDAATIAKRQATATAAAATVASGGVSAGAALTAGATTASATLASAGGSAAAAMAAGWTSSGAALAAGGASAAAAMIAGATIASLLMSSSGSGGGGILGTALDAAADIAGIPLFARGGPVVGPGTSTSDSIPARLSRGEFVVSAAAVHRIGVAELAAWNAGVVQPHVIAGLPRFAQGGLVTPPASGGTGRAGGAAHLTVSLADGLVAQLIESAAGEKAIIRVAGRHTRQLSTLLRSRGS